MRHYAREGASHPQPPPPLRSPHPCRALQEDQRRNDAVSHHILRLAFAGSDETRRWLLLQETALFKFRLEAESPEQVSEFMGRNALNFVPVRGRWRR